MAQPADIVDIIDILSERRVENNLNNRAHIARNYSYRLSLDDWYGIILVFNNSSSQVGGIEFD